MDLKLGHNSVLSHNSSRVSIINGKLGKLWARRWDCTSSYLNACKISIVIRNELVVLNRQFSELMSSPRDVSKQVVSRNQCINQWLFGCTKWHSIRKVVARNGRENRKNQNGFWNKSNFAEVTWVRKRIESTSVRDREPIEWSLRIIFNWHVAILSAI